MTRDVAIAGTVVQPKPRTLSERVVQWMNKTPVHIALGLVGLVWLAPTVGLLVTSFRPRSDIQATGWWETIFTLRFTTENYDQVLSAQGMGQAFVNTLFIAVPSTFLLVVAMLMVPVQVAFIPLLTMFRPTGLLTNYGAIWLAHTAFALPFGIFLLRNFFITLPRDLIEAARIDGASALAIFRTIVVPLSVPAIAAYGIFQFLWVWNDLLMALVFVQNGSLQPMTIAINGLLGTYGSEWNVLAAGAFLLMAVPLLVFFSLQRYFVQGLLAGSVK